MTDLTKSWQISLDVIRAERSHYVQINPQINKPMETKIETTETITKQLDLAKVAYDAYCNSREWKSVRGEPLPQFDKQSDELQTAWIASVSAVLIADINRLKETVVLLADQLERIAKEIREQAKLI